VPLPPSGFQGEGLLVVDPGTGERTRLYGAVEPTIDVPTLVVWGQEDTWIPVDRAHRLCELIPGARLHLVEDAGHLIQLDQPEALTAALASWLST